MKKDYSVCHGMYRRMKMAGVTCLVNIPVLLLRRLLMPGGSTLPAGEISK